MSTSVWTSPACEAIHKVYCQATKLDLPYRSFDHDSIWYQYLKRFDEHDLRLVVAYLKDLYRSKPEILTASIRFRKLILELDVFEMYKAEARCWKARKNEHTPQRSVLASAGIKAEPKQTDARPIGEVVKGLECLKKLKEEMNWK
jgi:hypothetical protein